jgi:hypothetical protein
MAGGSATGYIEGALKLLKEIKLFTRPAKGRG